MGPRELDQVGPRQQRAARQHHHLLARFQHRPADFFQQRGGGAFDREIGMLGKFIELDDRAIDVLLFQPVPRLAGIAGGDGGQAQARQAVGQPPRHRLADGAQPRDGDARRNHSARSHGNPPPFVIRGMARHDKPDRV